MPALDSCQPQVIRALEKAGWKVSPVPHAIRAPKRRYPLLADIRASRGSEEIIIVEVKCFLDDPLAELYSAIGQYLIYRSLLRLSSPDYSLYMAVPTEAYHGILNDIGMDVIRESQIKLLIVDLAREVIDQWLA